MSYSKQTWGSGVAGGTPITATRLNNMENGIAAATQYLGSGTAFPATGVGPGDKFTRSDLNAMFQYDGTNWQPVNPGQMLGKMWRTAGVQNLTLSAFVTVVMGASRVGGGFVFDSANNRLQLPIDGLYRVGKRGYLTTTAGQSMLVFNRQRSGVADLTIGGHMMRFSGADEQQTSEDVVPLKAADYLQLQAYSYSGPPQVFGNGENGGAALWAQWVAPLNGATPL